MSNDLNVDQFQTPINVESDALVVATSESLGFEYTASNQDLRIADVVLDPVKGLLSIVLAGGQTLDTSGFLVKSQIGKGPLGKKGKAGKAGRNGRDGRDGVDGESGCDGSQGERGVIGSAGADGPDGEKGIDGDQGDYGDKGPRGDKGSTGPTGPDGVQGHDGMDCVRGATGPAGPAPNPYAYFGVAIPTDPAIFAWCTPAIRGQPRPVIQKYQPLTLTVTKPTVTSKRYKNSFIFIAEFDIQATAKGGTGSYQYNWEPEALTGTEYTKNGKRLHVKTTTHAKDGEIVTVGADVKLVVYDVGQATRPSISTTTSFKVKAVG